MKDEFGGLIEHYDYPPELDGQPFWVLGLSIEVYLTVGPENDMNEFVPLRQNQI